MRLFRSEEHVRHAYQQPGATFEPERLWALAQAWYGDRLDPAWSARSREESQALLDGVGLTGALWRLA